MREYTDILNFSYVTFAGGYIQKNSFFLKKNAH